MMRFDPRTLSAHNQARWGYSFACENLHTFTPNADSEGYLAARARFDQARRILALVEGRMESERIDAFNRQAEPFWDCGTQPKTPATSRFAERMHGSGRATVTHSPTRFPEGRGHDREGRHAS